MVGKVDTSGSSKIGEFPHQRQNALLRKENNTAKLKEIRKRSHPPKGNKNKACKKKRNPALFMTCPKKKSPKKSAPSQRGSQPSRKGKEPSSEEKERDLSKIEAEQEFEAFAALEEAPERDIEFPVETAEEMTEEVPALVDEPTEEVPKEPKPAQKPKQKKEAIPEQPKTVGRKLLSVLSKRKFAKQPQMKQPTEAPAPKRPLPAQVSKGAPKGEVKEVKKEEPLVKKEKAKGESKRASIDTEGEKGVQAAAQPPIQGTGFSTEKAQGTTPAARSATIRELAAQIIERIQVMRKKDETHTMVTLRHPPILAGATLTIATTDQAKKECTITFANLSPEAKVFLDRKLKEDSLTENLDRKGIVVHQLTTTTEAQPLVATEAGQASKDQQGQQQQRRQPSQEESEEES